ncbi:hypothetical protein ACFCT7_00520 [Fulvivirgaceae bacterium LMO-SS25]
MKRNISLLALALLIAACNNTNQPVTVPATFETKQLISIMQNPQSVSKESIAKIAGTDASKIKVYNEKFSPDVSKRTILFSWANGEKKSVTTIDGKELQLEGHSSMGLGFVRKISKTDFQKNKESKTAVQDEINRITKDKTIDVDIAIAEAKQLAGNAKIQQFEKLGNVGEISYWETPVNALHVFAKDISFTVTTNLADEKTSREKAIEFAQLVFNNQLKSSK